MKENFLIYGAYGYTGKLIVELATQKGYKPILAGRNAEKTKQLADQYGLAYQVFDVQDESALIKALSNVKVILHCAGPFSETTPAVLKACLATKTHYLDITGEIEVFEYAAHKNQKALEAGIAVLPGVGFDVVPSDCLASFLKAQLPDATHLELAFRAVSELSRGTALTMALNMHKQGAIREGGKIKKVPAAYQTKKINYDGSKEWLSVTIPWGDVSTAFYSTQIPNIQVYMSQPPSAIKYLKWSNYFGWFLKTDFAKNYLRKKINATVKGPSSQKREEGRSYLWGQVKNASGKTVEARLQTPEGYKLTALTALLATEKVMNDEVKAGFQTPSMAFGNDFILQVQGTKRELL